MRVIESPAKITPQPNLAARVATMKLLVVWSYAHGTMVFRVAEAIAAAMRDRYPRLWRKA